MTSEIRLTAESSGEKREAQIGTVSAAQPLRDPRPSGQEIGPVVTNETGARDCPQVDPFPSPNQFCLAAASKTGGGL